MTPNELLVAGYRMGLRMVHMMCDDLTDHEFRHQPVPGTNSPAWVVGHLAVTIRRTADRFGATDLPVLTAEYIGRYSVTKQPAGVQTDLGEKSELLALLDTCVEKLMGVLPAVPAEALAQPAPKPGQFATNYADAILFGALHVTMHCGQLSTVRRSLGKPPAV